MKQRSRQWERRAKRLGMGSLGEAKFATRFGGFVGLIVAAMFLLNTLAHLLSQPWVLGQQGVESIGIPALPISTATGTRFRSARKRMFVTADTAASQQV